MKPHNASATSPEAPMTQLAIGAMLARVLATAGYAADTNGDVLMLPTGLRLEPALLETQKLDDGGIATLTRIVAFHETAFPHGLPEMLHAAGADAAQAVAQGFAAWAQATLPVLEDAVRDDGPQSALLAIRLPGPGVGVFRVYQAILGPILHLGPIGHSGPDVGEFTEDEESCPACMTTRVQDLLRDRLPGIGCTGITLVAGRDAQGRPIADCRINGEPFAEGAARLTAYAQSWPGKGQEVRAQYVIVRPPKPPAS